MNREAELLSLIRVVLGLSIGEVQIIREPHLLQGRVFLYRDGWHFFIDHALDRIGYPRALLGYWFRDPQDMADFLTGDLGRRAANFAEIGERIDP